MNKEVFDSIYTRFKATCIGKLYNTEADADAVFPYTVLSIVSNVPGEGEFGVDWEDYLIQFVLYSKLTTSTEINTAFKTLCTAFDHHDLVIEDAEIISMEREPANLRRVEKKWKCMVTYRLLFERT